MIKIEEIHHLPNVPRPFLPDPYVLFSGFLIKMPILELYRAEGISAEPARGLDGGHIGSMFKVAHLIFGESVRRDLLNALAAYEVALRLTPCWFVWHEFYCFETVATDLMHATLAINQGETTWGDKEVMAVRRLWG